MNELAQYPVIHEQAVAWGDMDAFGHVNNVLYYRYIESARIRYLDALNIFDEKIYTVVASNQCKYLSARVEEIRNSAFRMSYLLWSTMQEKVVAKGEAVMVVVDPVQLAKQAIPDHVKQKILMLEQQVGHQLNT